MIIFVILFIAFGVIAAVLLGLVVTRYIQSQQYAAKIMRENNLRYFACDIPFDKKWELYKMLWKDPVFRRLGFQAIGFWLAFAITTMIALFFYALADMSNQTP